MNPLRYATFILFMLLCQAFAFFPAVPKIPSYKIDLNYLQRYNVPRINFKHVLRAKENGRTTDVRDCVFEKKKKRKTLNNQRDKTTVILYHKPKGVITSHSNNDALPSISNVESKRFTVYDDIKSMEGYINTDPNNNAPTERQSFEKATGIESKLHAIGRLDTDTTGLLLLTNDGQLVHHVTNPTASSSKGNKLVKVYDAVIMGYHTLDEDEDGCNSDIIHSSSASSRQLKKLLKGVDIGNKYGGMTQPPEDLRVLGHPSSKSTLVRITISEGKNRQVRRMFHAINSGVIHLHRRTIGTIDLEMMQDHGSLEGDWRLLTDKEILDGLGWKVRQLDSGTTATTKRRKDLNYGKRRKMGRRG